MRQLEWPNDQNKRFSERLDVVLKSMRAGEGRLGKSSFEVHAGIRH